MGFDKTSDDYDRIKRLYPKRTKDGCYDKKNMECVFTRNVVCPKDTERGKDKKCNINTIADVNTQILAEELRNKITEKLVEQGGKLSTISSLSVNN